MQQKLTDYRCKNQKNCLTLSCLIPEDSAKSDFVSTNIVRWPAREKKILWHCQQRFWFTANQCLQYIGIQILNRISNGLSTINPLHLKHMSSTASFNRLIGLFWWAVSNVNYTFFFTAANCLWKPTNQRIWLFINLLGPFGLQYLSLYSSLHQ